MSSSSAPRSSPPIPDHEMLRKIGQGSYGEVWLARGVTGAWRAVKVVYRDDFDDAQTFEREFKGLLAYEPISRRCEGLVQILHVGRNRTKGFYYYVMELGDDETQVREVKPIEFQPRTLRGDLLKMGALPLGDARRIAWQLVDAMGFLHEHDLVHRDIKPGNVIFVDGNAKLADVGLVAAFNQNTYVGTEGFSPPEGPGSLQGDVYAMGKVLYEMATGKDRLSFPDPPEEFESDEHRREWLAFDTIICKACSPDPRKRYRDGRAMERAVSALMQDTSGVQMGWKQTLMRRKWMGAGAAALVLLVGLLWTGLAGLFDEDAGIEGGAQAEMVAATEGGENGKQVGEPDADEGAEQEQQVEPVRVRFWSKPSGAEIWINDRLVDTTPALLDDMVPGDSIAVRFEREGYRSQQQQQVVPESNFDMGVVMEEWNPPVTGRFWENSVGAYFDPVGRGHASELPIKSEIWYKWDERIMDGEVRDYEVFWVMDESGKYHSLVAASQEDVQEFIAWMEENDRQENFLGEERYYELKPLSPFELQRMGYQVEGADWPDLPAWQMRVLPYLGVIRVETNPRRVRVELDGTYLTSITPLVIPDLEPGTYELSFESEGYASELHRVVIDKHGHEVEVAVSLRPQYEMVPGTVWENTLDMEFVRIDQQMMASVYETRIRDFRAMAEDVGFDFEPWEPSSVMTDEHPVTNISRVEAEAFALWLTEREHEMGRIRDDQFYRLPTDAEWSALAQLNEVQGMPAELDGAVTGFAWGQQWPPPLGAANLGVNPDDGFMETAPVGRFQTENQGMYDISGNVWEWVSSAYSEDRESALGVVRGGSYLTVRRSEAMLSTRNLLPPLSRDAAVGFRLILERDPMHVSREVEAQEVFEPTQDSEQLEQQRVDVFSDTVLQQVEAEQRDNSPWFVHLREQLNELASRAEQEVEQVEEGEQDERSGLPSETEGEGQLEAEQEQVMRDYELYLEQLLRDDFQRERLQRLMDLEAQRRRRQGEAALEEALKQEQESDGFEGLPEDGGSEDSGAADVGNEGVE